MEQRILEKEEGAVFVFFDDAVSLQIKGLKQFVLRSLLTLLTCGRMELSTVGWPSITDIKSSKNPSIK